MDSINRVLLDRIQRSFPLSARPYDVLSEGLGIDGEEVRRRIHALKERNLLRQISAIFNTGALGYRSSLVAMSVPEGEVERAGSVVNLYPGVSHNYLRPGNYNMWFTIAVPPGQSLEKTVVELAERAGGWPTLILPALKKYKLAVVLDVLEEGEAGEDSSGTPVVEALTPFLPTEENVRVVRCIQEDLPLVENPFEVWADSLGMTEADLLNLISRWVSHGFIRRFAAVLNHRQVGFSANGMVVWNCPPERLDGCGTVLSSHAEVSHCYCRPSYPDWPYNLYAMVHARREEECRSIAEKLGNAIGLKDYRILFSTREFKKIRLKLFWS